MNRISRPARVTAILPLIVLIVLKLPASLVFGAGVTLITHGYRASVDDWVTGMANRIPAHRGFYGSKPTIYKVTLQTDEFGQYTYGSDRSLGVPIGSSDSGEIILKLDWSQMAGGHLFGYNESTYDVAWVAAWVLLQTNAIPELGGHALVEFPLHMIGHSRGGSLVNEISRILGTNGVWVDHLTTLDPHPLNNDGNFDPLMPFDATAACTYANVVFRDNYWQDVPLGLGDVNGQPADGAYNRHLGSVDLLGGYDGLVAANHSDVHLWYHGTIDLNTPNSDGTASVTRTERETWWTPDELQGATAGFYYSRIGGGDRLSAERPLGFGTSTIRDGYNQLWDLGAGTASNRTGLESIAGNWANLLRLALTETNTIAPGGSFGLDVIYQWAKPSSDKALLSIYLDRDRNPLNTNEMPLQQFTASGTGAESAAPGAGTISVPLPSANLPPGSYFVLGAISDRSRTRYQYAPDPLRIVNPERATVRIAQLDASSVLIEIRGPIGRAATLQASSDLVRWHAVATNIISAQGFCHTNTVTSTDVAHFYRAEVTP